MPLVSDLINQAFLDLGVIAAGESITANEQADAFLRFQQMVASWSSEQLTVYTIEHQSFTLTPGTATYTVGPGGTLTVGTRPMRITGAHSVSGAFQKAMRVISWDQFASEVNDSGGQTSVLGEVLAADNAFPLVNVKIFPTPAVLPGNLLLDFWIPFPAFVTVGDTVDFAPGYEAALHFNLAVHLYPQYGRAGGIDPVLAANAHESKASLVALSASILGMQPAQQSQPQQAPQGQ